MWRASGTAIRETTKRGDEIIAYTTATTSHTTTKAFPLKYFVLAFAFTWFFWGLGVLGERGFIPTLPGFTVIGTFGPMVAAVILTAVLWVAAFAVMLVYGVRNLSRKPRQVLANAGNQFPQRVR